MTVNNVLQCPSQQAAYLLSTAMDTIPNTVSTVSGGSTTTSTQAVAQSAIKNSGTGAVQSGTSSPANPIIFNVSGVTSSPGVTLLAYVVIIRQPTSGPQFTFASNPFIIKKQSRRNLLQDFDLQPLDSDVPYPPCSVSGVLCGEVEFNRNSGQGFGPNDFMNFSLAILKGGAPVSLGDLCGAQAAFIYSDGYTPVSNLGSCSNSSTTLVATSVSQDPMTVAQIGTVPTSPPPNNSPACTSPNAQCSNPVTSGVTDSNPLTGLESPQCYDVNGFPIPCGQ